MDEQRQHDVLLRLAEDVAGMKRDVANMVESQRSAWMKLDQVSGAVNNVDRKVDGLNTHEDRIAAVEDDVATFNRLKNRLYGAMSILGVSAGGLAGALSSWFSNFFDRQ